MNTAAAMDKIPHSIKLLVYRVEAAAAEGSEKANPRIEDTKNSNPRSISR